MNGTANPLEPAHSLKRPLNGEPPERMQPSQQTIGTASAVTTAEEAAEDGVGLKLSGDLGASDPSLPPKKRVKLDSSRIEGEQNEASTRKRVKGVALVKEEYLIQHPKTRTLELAANPEGNSDTTEIQRPIDDRDRGNNGAKKTKKKNKGQNTARQCVYSKDTISLCHSRANSAEFSPKQCNFGDRCNLSHDLRKYLREGKRPDLATFNGRCPVWEASGKCYAGWKCRFLSSHMEEVDTEDGRKELTLTVDLTRATTVEIDDDENRAGIVNITSSQDRYDLSKRKTTTEKADKYAEWVERDSKELFKIYHKKKANSEENGQENDAHVDVDKNDTKESRVDLEDNRARYIEPPFRPAEKRKVYFGPETPILAPLTTQGNLPFRRLCVELGAQLTYSEMAMTLPLIQGQRSEWALMKAHQTEMLPPQFLPKPGSVVQGYENSRDFKFGAQIAANKPSVAIKATEILTNLLPRLRVIDLNCGCPIELVYRAGAGSSLLESPSKLEKIIRGMNALSGEIPITAKIRMGSKDGKPTAYKLVERLALGSEEIRDRLGPPGCAAVTLHGRSRQQRYTRSADWGYISECAALIKSFQGKQDALIDTANDPDPRQLPNGQKMYFIGNGDCYSHVDYVNHINNSGVDAVMLARGALIKPWLFEEIEKGQYLDKSASERLAYVEKFTRYGLEAWGSDSMGIGQTRRFLLEWLSFAHRYVPVGILEHLPPSLQDRPPAYRGRNDMETLLASDNYLDWIKISEMFLGPAGADFKFQPKHKSNSYEIEAEG